MPVIVVLPSSKRDKSRVKRAQDPSRQTYKELMEKSGAQDIYNLSASNRNSFVGTEENLPASEDEAAAVAKAIGYKAPLARSASPLAQVQTPPSKSGDAVASAEEEQQSPGVVMRSPTLLNSGSPGNDDPTNSDGDSTGCMSTDGNASDTIKLKETTSTAGLGGVATVELGSAETAETPDATSQRDTTT